MQNSSENTSNHPNFTPTGMWQSTREKEIAAFREGVTYGEEHWKANAYRLKKENRRLRMKIRLLTQELETGL